MTNNKLLRIRITTKLRIRGTLTTKSLPMGKMTMNVNNFKSFYRTKNELFF